MDSGFAVAGAIVTVISLFSMVVRFSAAEEDSA